MNFEPEKILVRGVNWLGDAIMSTPALRRLREARPRAHITLLTDEKLADLWRHFPAVDAVITFARNESVWSVANRLRPHHFQLGLILPNSHRAAFELWFARIPQRVGYAAPLRNWLLTQSIEPRTAAVRMRKRSTKEIDRLIHCPTPAPRSPAPPGVHHLFQYLNMVAALGASAEPLRPQLAVTDAEVDAAKNKSKLAGEQPIFGLNAGAEYGPAKRWPKERFAAAAIEVQRRTNCRWLILGGPDDAELAGWIVGEIALHASRPTPPINLAGHTTLSELCALLKLCRVLLTNDTGPMHLGAAVGTPVVALFGSTSPGLTAPGLPGDPRHCVISSNVACSPCYRRECPIDFRCMRGITVEAVVSAVLNVWNQQGRGG
jgi:heptosyltransferase-2